jgi:hypothetical protein
MALRIYDIRDFCKTLEGAGSSGERPWSESSGKAGMPNPEELIQEIKRRTEGLWGRGAAIEWREYVLAVVQTQEVHEKIVAIIEAIRKDPKTVGQPIPLEDARAKPGVLPSARPAAAVRSKTGGPGWLYASAAVAAGGLCLIALLRLLRRRRA